MTISISKESIRPIHFFPSNTYIEQPHMRHSNTRKPSFRCFDHPQLFFAGNKDTHPPLHTEVSVPFVWTSTFTADPASTYATVQKVGG